MPLLHHPSSFQSNTKNKSPQTRETCGWFAECPFRGERASYRRRSWSRKGASGVELATFMRRSCYLAESPQEKPWLSGHFTVRTRFAGHW